MKTLEAGKSPFFKFRFIGRHGKNIPREMPVYTTVGKIKNEEISIVLVCNLFLFHL